VRAEKISLSVFNNHTIGLYNFTHIVKIFMAVFRFNCILLCFWKCKTTGSNFWICTDNL